MKSLKFLTNGFCASLLAFIAAALAQAPADSPADVAKSFAQAIRTGNTELAKTLISKESKLDHLPPRMKEAPANPAASVRETGKGGAAVFLDFGEKGSVSLTLIQQDGKWKVDVKNSRAFREGEFVKTDVDRLSTQLQLYEVQNGFFPSNQQGLQALVDRPTTEPLPRRWRRLLSDMPLDDWGTPYAYKYPAVRSKREFDLYSFGPDRKDGTSDDIGNW